MGADLQNSEFNIARPSYYFFNQLYFAADAPYGMAAGWIRASVSTQPAQLADNFRHWRNLEIGAFIQDDWKVSRKLTVNIGLRYTPLPVTRRRLHGDDVPAGARLHVCRLDFNANIRGTPGLRYADAVGQERPGGRVWARVAVADKLGAGRNHFGCAPALPTIRGQRQDGLPRRKTFGVSYEGTLYNPLSNSRWNPPCSFNGVNNARS